MCDSRISWDEYFKQLSILTSQRSVCQRLKVGCLLVKDNRLISQGYNGYLPKCPHIDILQNNHNISIIHAEQNAISDCAKRGVSCDLATAYITHFPCINCFKSLAASGIIHIKYINDYNNENEVLNLCQQANILIEKI